MRQRFGLALLYGYLASPIVIQAAAHGWRDLRDLVFLFNIVASASWIALAHFLTRRPMYLHLALFPLYITTTVDLFLLNTFGTRLTSGYVNIVLGNRTDTADFLSTFWQPVLIAAVAFLVIYLAGLYCVRGFRKAGSPKSAALTAAALAGAYLLLARHFILWPGEPIGRIALDVAAHETSAPLGALFQTGLALKLDRENRDMLSRRSSYSFGASKSPQSDDEVYVWVIGESSRPDNWSMFGYTRDTSPRLRAIPGIIAFPRMMTTAPETLIAVPSMLSLRPITDWPSVQAQKSVVSAFNEAGFKTYWLSTQDVDGWSGLVPQVAAEAATVRYFSQSFDGVLLNEFRGIIDKAPRGNSKLFIVLHTKGSHFDYKRRYPPEFAHFLTPLGTRRSHIVDTYDDSILYTDWFLSELISILSAKNMHSSLLYSSDHGENLLDDERQLLGHTRGTKYDLSTSSFIWVSKEVRKRHPDWVSNVAQHAALPLSLSNLSHSMLELADIHAPALDLQMSIFNSTFALHPRSYLQGGEVRGEPAELMEPP